MAIRPSLGSLWESCQGKALTERDTDSHNQSADWFRNDRLLWQPADAPRLSLRGGLGSPLKA